MAKRTTISVNLRQRGSAAMEFALTLPILIGLLLGVGDGAVMMLVSQRVDRIAYSVTDIVTQQQTVTKADLDNTFLAAGELMQPFAFGENGIVIVSSLYKPTGQAVKMSWQYRGGGTLERSSLVGLCDSSNNCTTPTMPSGLSLNDNENVIIAEVFYAYRPLFFNAGILSMGDFYRPAIYKPRLSPLITPPV